MGHCNLAQARHPWFNVALIQQFLHGNHPEFSGYCILGVKQGGYFS
jgi:hypothetical protein